MKITNSLISVDVRGALLQLAACDALLRRNGQRKSIHGAALVDVDACRCQAHRGLQLTRRPPVRVMQLEPFHIAANCTRHILFTLHRMQLGTQFHMMMVTGQCSASLLDTLFTKGGLRETPFFTMGLSRGMS